MRAFSFNMKTPLNGKSKTFPKWTCFQLAHLFHSLLVFFFFFNFMSIFGDNLLFEVLFQEQENFVKRA